MLESLLLEREGGRGPLPARVGEWASERASERVWPRRSRKDETRRVRDGGVCKRDAWNQISGSRVRERASGDNSLLRGHSRALLLLLERGGLAGRLRAECGRSLNRNEGAAYTNYLLAREPGTMFPCLLALPVCLRWMSAVVTCPLPLASLL